MIRKQEKPMLTLSVMSPNDYEAAVAAFIRNRGVTRCPTACVVRTQASVSAADRAALEQYEAEREQSRRTNLAAAAALFGHPYHHLGATASVDGDARPVGLRQ
jgi:hypothetical protein